MCEGAAKAVVRPRRYDHYTRPEHRHAIRQCFHRNPHLARRFTERWVDGLVSPVKSRDEVAPLFWALVHPISQERLVQALKYVDEQRGIGQVILDLQSHDENNVAATLSELEIFRMLRLRHLDTEWKPTEGPGKRAADLRFGAREGRSVVVEVLTIRRGERDCDEQRALDEIRLFLDGLGHRYLVEYELQGPLSCRHVDTCCAFLRTHLMRLGERRSAGQTHADFMVKGHPLMKFRFRRTTGRGCWVGGFHDVRQSRESGRIKHKLLDKLTKFQLPQGGDALKGYVLVLDDLVHDEESVRAAVLGRVGVAVRMGRDGKPEMNVIRQADGNVHDSRRGELLTTEVDFIASMKRPGGMFVTPLDVLVNGDRKRVTREEVCDLLWGRLP